jgi:hypothetical protein
MSLFLNTANALLKKATLGVTEGGGVCGSGYNCNRSDVAFFSDGFPYAVS